MFNLPVVGVDLDGTLAEYHGWKGYDHIGEPVQPMLERVKGWLESGKYEVQIVTARVSSDSGRDAEVARKAIEKWCEKHVGKKLVVTAEKSLRLVALWDDRAIQVIKNTGIPVGRVED